MNMRTMNKPRNREKRTRATSGGYAKITLYISPCENEQLRSLMQKSGYTREEIFLHGMCSLMGNSAS